MKNILLIATVLFSYISEAQTFYVSGSDNRSVLKTVNKIRFLGYNVVDSSKADYIVNQLIDGHYQYVSFSRNFKGYVTITDRETGAEMWKSEIEKASPSMYNGYNASARIFSKIDDRSLPNALKNIPKKVASTK